MKSVCTQLVMTHTIISIKRKQPPGEPLHSGERKLRRLLGKGMGKGDAGGGTSGDNGGKGHGGSGYGGKGHDSSRVSEPAIIISACTAAHRLA